MNLRPDTPPVNSLLPDTLLLPARTVCGNNVPKQMASAVQAWGPRGLVLHGQALDAQDRRTAFLSGFAPGMQIILRRHGGGEPTLSQVDAVRDEARRHTVDWVAAIGGGSVMDCAKAAAGLLHAPHPARQYHRGAPIPASRVPFAAIPTTAGTGSEATSVSVLTDDETGLKQSIRHPTFLPSWIGLDPQWLRNCPPDVIAAAGMDAMTQAIESFLSRHACPFSRPLSMTAMAAIAESLPVVHAGNCASPDWESHARRLLEASYLAGLALSHARLGIVHGLAHPLGARLRMPHGKVCALCLPAALNFNRSTCAAALREITDCIGSDPEPWTRHWLDAFGFHWPSPSDRLDDVDTIIGETLASGSTAANPRTVTAQDVRSLLKQLPPFANRLP